MKTLLKLFALLAVIALALSWIGACGDDDDDDDNAGSDVWQDGNTGLTWQVNPDSILMTWQEAMDYCDGLSLDGSDAWRLPNIDELCTIIEGCPETETGGECGMVDVGLGQLFLAPQYSQVPIKCPVSVSTILRFEPQDSHLVSLLKTSLQM